MRPLRLGLILLSTASASCTLFGRLQSDGRPVFDVAASPQLSVADPSPLKAPKAVPVLSPPEVFAVYVTSHVDRERDLMVGEHWVFFKLSESEWFADRRTAPEPPAAGAAGPELLKQITGLDGIDRAVIPHRETTP